MIIPDGKFRTRQKNVEVTKMIEIVEEENTPLIFLTYVT